MSTELSQLTINDLTVEIIRKKIKNLHLGVYPPLGRIRVAAPLLVSDEAIRLAVIGKIGWIRKQQAKFNAQPRQSKRELVNGESHYFMGQRYRLRVIEQNRAARVEIRNKALIDLHVRPGSTTESRDKVMHDWYRAELKALIPPLLEKWQPLMGVSVNAWGIKQMKTRWGTCNPSTQRIWLNLELAKKAPHCLEFVLVHELNHLLERHHNDNFTALMDKFLPHWRLCREELRQAPLGHERWKC